MKQLGFYIKDQVTKAKDMPVHVKQSNADMNKLHFHKANNTCVENTPRTKTKQTNKDQSQKLFQFFPPSPSINISLTFNSIG